MPTIHDVLPWPANIDDLPAPEPFYHVAASNGLFAMRNTMYGRALVPVKTIDYLDKGQAYLWTDIPKLPAWLISRVWAFFRWAYAERGSESMVYLVHDDIGYDILVPEQTTTYASVHATLDPKEIPAGAVLAGTIHSHCDFGGFHSSTDRADAAKHDGLHLTIGDVDKDKPDIAAMVSINGIVWDLDLDECLEMDPSTDGRFPEAWKDRIELPVPPRHTPNQSMTVYNWDDDWYDSKGYLDKIKRLGLDDKPAVSGAVLDTGYRYLSDILDDLISWSATDNDDETVEFIDTLLETHREIDQEIDNLIATLESIGVHADISLTCN